MNKNAKQCKICSCSYDPEKTQIVSCSICLKSFPKEHSCFDHEAESNCIVDGGQCGSKCYFCDKYICKEHEFEMFTFIWRDSQRETHELCRDCINIPRALYLINFDVSGYISELIQGQEELKHELLELKKKVESLQLQVDYQPGGRGAKEAQRSFESLSPFLT